ncbi:MAG: tryptophan-rich sensory protein [Sphingosinicella sp.]|nr:tryptophan-rich sensory protein [Sphingosinicella sp.]
MTDQENSEIRARPFWRYAIFTIPIILGIGFLMGQLSNSGYGNDWFDALRKPDAMPPGWMFGAAWSLLYILLGIAIALILSAPSQRGRGLAIGLFTTQMLLNYSWSPVFFGMHRASEALVIIVTMLALSIATIFVFRTISRPAAWLMLPYLAWLGFASFLNYEIVRLNP